MKNILTVPPESRGKRLDLVLKELLQGYSRSYCQQLINEGFVSIDGVKSHNPSQKVLGDSIQYTLPKKAKLDNNIPILYEDENVVVIDKPEGILSHAKGFMSTEVTVSDYFRDKILNDDSNRAGIVHRLDRATSGVMIVAKNLNTKKYLQKQFSQRKTYKKYIALSQGIIKQDDLLIEWPIARNPKKPSTFCVSHNGKTASTKLSVLNRYNQMTKVKLEPETGRTHQLRVHLNKLGHPIIGDYIYNGPKPKSKPERMYLHAFSLEISLPEVGRKTFMAPEPDTFAKEEKLYG